MTGESEPLQDNEPASLLNRAFALIALLLAILGLFICAASALLLVLSWLSPEEYGWAPLGALVAAAGLVLALAALAFGLAVYLPARRRGQRRRVARWALTLTVSAIVLVGAMSVLTIGVSLVRPSGPELVASGHDEPTHALQARLALGWARASLVSDFYWPDADVAGLIPVYLPLPEPGSQSSVFAATRDEGRDYLAAFYRGETLVGVVNWDTTFLGFDDGIRGAYEYDVRDPEKLLREDLGGQPDALRYVEAGNGFWVVARSGERERGVFVSYQGMWECWPRGDTIYSGAAVLRYLQHMEDHHSQFGECDGRRDWE